MDAGKLQNVLTDLSNNPNAAIDLTLNTLSTSIGENKTNEIAENVELIRKLYKEDVVNQYSPSNLKILTAIGGLSYFGQTGLVFVEAILERNTYDIQRTANELKAYIESRKKFVELVASAKTNLQELGIKSYYHDDTVFEIGIIMPQNNVYNKITNLTKELNHWDKVLKTVTELVGDPPEDTEIALVSTGSLQFFIDHTSETAIVLATVLERVVRLYRNIVEIRIAKDKLKELGIAPAEQKAVDKQEKELFNREIDKLSKDIVTNFASSKIEEGRLNELQIAMKGHVKYVVKCVGDGMTIEITPPEIAASSDEPVEGDEHARKELQVKQEKVMTTIEVVQKSMESVKSIGELGGDIAKLLTEGDDKTQDEV